MDVFASKYVKIPWKAAFVRNEGRWSGQFAASGSGPVQERRSCLDGGLDKIMSQSLNMFELGAPSLVMAGRFRTQTEVIRLENLAPFLCCPVCYACR